MDECAGETTAMSAGIVRVGTVVRETVSVGRLVGLQARACQHLLVIKHRGELARTEQTRTGRRAVPRGR